MVLAGVVQGARQQPRLRARRTDRDVVILIVRADHAGRVGPRAPSPGLGYDLVFGNGRRLLMLAQPGRGIRHVVL
jgi:hypothetical protein